MSDMLPAYTQLNNFIAEQNEIVSVYRNGQWGQCLDLVKHLCQYSENILFVVAQDGMGKTTLKNTLKNIAEKNFKWLDIQASSVLSVNKLMQNIAVGFGIAFDNIETPVSDNKNDVWVLVIDDAEQLTTEMLGALFQLRESAKGLLHIVLFAKPSLESRILESAWREAFETYVHVIELEPLTLSETEFLLQHQWKLAGNRINLPFDRAAINTIHSLSGGITSEVLKLAKSQISGEQVENKTLFATFLGVLSPVMLGLTLLFGVVFVLISFFLPSDSETNVANTPLEIQQNDDVQAESMASALLEEDNSVQFESSPEIFESPASVAQSVPVETAQEQTVAATSNLEKIIAENNLLIEKNRQLELNITNMQKSLDAPEPAAKLASKSPDAQALPLITNKTLALGDNLAQSEKTILGIEKNKFTIQLLASAHEKGILDFIASNKLGNKAHYYRSVRDGKNWFILIYGDYSSRAEATAAVKSLPEAVQSLKPWTRDLASIQTVIKKES